MAFGNDSHNRKSEVEGNRKNRKPRILFAYAIKLSEYSLFNVLSKEGRKPPVALFPSLFRNILNCKQAIIFSLGN